jgi:hypothetical protein
VQLLIIKFYWNNFHPPTIKKLLRAFKALFAHKINLNIFSFDDQMKSFVIPSNMLMNTIIVHYSSFKSSHTPKNKIEKIYSPPTFHHTYLKCLKYTSFIFIPLSISLLVSVLCELIELFMLNEIQYHSLFTWCTLMRENVFIWIYARLTSSSHTRNTRTNHVSLTSHSQHSTIVNASITFQLSIVLLCSCSFVFIGVFVCLLAPSFFVSFSLTIDITSIIVYFSCDVVIDIVFCISRYIEGWKGGRLIASSVCEQGKRLFFLQIFYSLFSAHNASFLCFSFHFIEYINRFH